MTATHKATVAAILFCETAVDRWVKRFHAEGVQGVAGHKPGRPFRLAADWVKVVVEWVTTKTPRDFGFLRSRWCCEAVALVMLREHEVEVSRETVRRWLHRGGLVYRRPRPTLGPTDGRWRAGTKLRAVLADLPDDEDSRLPGRVRYPSACGSSMRMVKGHQAEVETLGNDEKPASPG